MCDCNIVTGDCNNYAWAVHVAFWLAVLPFLLYIAHWLIYAIRRHYRRKHNKPFLWYDRNTGLKASALFSFCFMASLGLLMFVSGRHEFAHGKNVAYRAEWLENVLNSVFSAIRAIGVPEHYLEFVDKLRAYLQCARPDHVDWHNAVVVLASLLRVAIPFAGSAFVLGAFAKAFPKIRLRLSYTMLKREKCYFSSLTPQSLALAKSILTARWEAGKLWSPLFVFTDVYVDDESEASYELMLEAKRLGAVCLRDDLAHAPKSRFGKRRYFLIEEMESDNLPALMNLVEERNLPYIQDAKIYLMVQSDLHVRLEQNIRRRLDDVIRQKQDKKLKPPTIIPVNAYRNLVQNLLSDVPLYEPLVGTDQKKLSVTILGNGFIGTEAFLATYWFSQMMVSDKKGVHACPVDIHVVSQDDEKTFAAKLDYINPEILRSCEFSGNDCHAQDTLLNWDGTKVNAPYCRVEYHSVNVKRGSMCADASWLHSDYYIVALGTDADNIAVAEKLRLCIGQMRTESQKQGNVVVAYVVYDSDLCHTLNAGNCMDDGVYVRAFGNLEEVYSSDNVFMSGSKVRAAQTGYAYQQLRRKTADEAHEQDQEDRQALQKKQDSDAYDYNANYKANYNHLSSTARVLHTKYKVFTLGWIQTSLFEDKKTHDTEVEEACRYYARVCNALEGYLCPADEQKRMDLEEKKEYLAFLEHRRWNAFIRTIGYRHGAKRNDTLKLHPCLVEARGPEEGKPYCYMGEPKDNLDALGDYKKYDYPIGDAGQHRTISQILQTDKNNLLTEEEMLALCQGADAEDVFKAVSANGEEWFIPESVWGKWNKSKADRIEKEKKATEAN